MNTVLLSLVLALLFSFGASAGEERSSGSVTMRLPAQGSGVELTAYQVATFDGGYFTFADAFAGSGLENMDLNDSEQVERTIEILETLMTGRNGAAGTSGTADASGTVSIPNLQPGLYLIRQTGGEDRLLVQSALVPLPYAASDGSGWIYDVTLSPKNSFAGGAAILNKVDDEGKPVGGVQFVLQEKARDGVPAADAETGVDAEGSYFWREFKANLVTDENGQIVITGLPVGTYRFIETGAPEGLIFTGEPYEFSITRAGEAAQINGRYARSSGEVVELEIVNRQTRLEVDKLDENGNLLAGATLVLKDALGNAIHNENGEPEYIFTTEGVTFLLKRVAPGSYLLSEVQAPEGYQIAEDVPFVITGDELTPVKVTMTDKKIPKKNKNSLKVTKHLILTGLEDDLAATNETFYVALFSDQERTHRVSDVKAVVFQNSAVNSVTFENLGEGTYYVGETYADGVALTSGMIGDVVFTPEYGKNAEFTFEGKSGQDGQQGEAEVRNVFMEIPEGFYLSGEIEITKKVVKDGKKYKSKDTFYARVFSDADLTEPASDVVTLAMDGKSEAKVTVYDLSIGESLDSSATYYLAETDKKGVPLDPSAGKFAITIDHDTLVLDAQNSNQKTVITNELLSEDEKAEKNPESDSDSDSDAEVSSGTPTPKTGDDTNIMLYLILMALSAGVCAACAGLYLRRRRR